VDPGDRLEADTIQSLWIGRRLSVLEQLSMRSFLANGHRYRLYVYEDVENVPRGVEIADAGQVIPGSERFVSRQGSHALFSDWFRWELLHQKGGYWVDTDEICLKRFDFSDDLVFGLERPGVAAIGVLKFPRGSDFARWLADSCESPNKILPYDGKSLRLRKHGRRLFRGNRRSDVGWGEPGGPQGFTRALEHFDLMRHARPVPVFYPVHCTRWRSLFDDTFKDNHAFFEGSYGVHLWNEMLRATLDKEATFSPGSYVEHLKARYL
jgi:hypothetical protein